MVLYIVLMYLPCLPHVKCYILKIVKLDQKKQKFYIFVFIYNSSFEKDGISLKQ